MLTARGRWTLALALIGMTAGVFAKQEGVALTGLAMILWIGMEWFGFRRKTLQAGIEPIFGIRTIDGAQAETITLAIDQTYEVTLAGDIHPRLRGLRVRLEELMPPGLKLESGSTLKLLDSQSNPSSYRFDYQIQPQITGSTFLPGVRVLICDAQGLFQLQKFVSIPSELRILPFMIRPKSTSVQVKPSNVQLLTGNHRYRRPGFSTELLGIREYQKGDPPRSIAWKATARTGRLMTCEYENEVPIRATVIADLSPYQFWGRPRTSVGDRVICGAASIARLLIADRDPVAGMLVSDSEPMRIAHGGGQRQLTRLIQTMLAFSRQSADIERLSISDLVEVGWWNAMRLYPERFDERVNPPRPGWIIRPRRRRLAGMRQQLAHFLAPYYQKGPETAIRLRADNQLLRHFCRRFFSEHSVCELPRVESWDLSQRHAARRRANEQICHSLVEGVTRASDNELFVVIADFTKDELGLDQLENAMRIVRASYHRAILIDVGQLPPNQVVSDPDALRVLEATASGERNSGERRLGPRFEQMGIKTTRMDDPRMIERVAAEVELLKTGRTRGGAGTPHAVKTFS